VQGEVPDVSPARPSSPRHGRAPGRHPLPRRLRGAPQGVVNELEATPTPCSSSTRSTP
jgi:hypothetical protein